MSFGGTNVDVWRKRSIHTSYQINNSNTLAEYKDKVKKKTGIFTWTVNFLVLHI